MRRAQRVGSGLQPDVDAIVHDMALSVKDHMTLSVAGMRWASVGRKENHVHEMFGESLVRFSQRLNVLIDDPEAEAEYPALVHRLRRLRDRRRGVR